jgi:hypothetical protein
MRPVASRGGRIDRRRFVMEWLSQNWIWVVAIVGVVLLLSRARHGRFMGAGGHGMPHEGHHESPGGVDMPGASSREAGAPQAKGAAPSHRHRGGCC